MKQLRQIENIFSILIALFEVQIQTLQITDNRNMRRDVAAHVKKLAQVLLSSIEEIEQEFIDETEAVAEKILGVSAEMMNVILEAKKQLPQVEILKKFSEVAKAGHKEVTVELSEEEQEVTAEIVAHFTVMKNRVNSVLSRLEKI